MQRSSYLSNNYIILISSLNLDPAGECSDEVLWDSLEKSHLGETVRALPGGLSFAVSEGGDNLSAGQKQLLCLARYCISD